MNLRVECDNAEEDLFFKKAEILGFSTEAVGTLLYNVIEEIKNAVAAGKIYAGKNSLGTTKTRARLEKYTSIVRDSQGQIIGVEHLVEERPAPFGRKGV